MKRQSLLILLGLVLASVAAMPARAVENAAVGGGAQACKALAGTGFADVIDAPTSLISANYVAASAGAPAYCDVAGYVAPSEGFGLWMPANWNGKFLVRGCGGFCGIVAAEFACKDPIRLGYACLQTDMGHKSTLTDGAWAYHDLQAKIDFAYRSTHVTVLAGKAIVAAYYQRPAGRNYFLGCSTGGRQGMVEAQRFPLDFDGIASIAPAIDETGSAIQLTWSIAANRADGRNILPPEKVAMLHAAVVAACDMNDGVKDGLIGDPRRCSFRASRLACRGGDAPDCLTPQQLAVVEKLYSGPQDRTGRKLAHGGTFLGAEPQWVPAYVGLDDKPGTYAAMMQEFWRYLGFDQDPGPSWKLEQFDIDRDPARVGGPESLYTGENPDLRRFKAAGGKLLLAHGWADESVVPGTSLDYYADATRFMDGPAATREFFRLFMIPGMKHCTGGEGAYGINYLAVLENWVENAQAPERIVGQRPKEGVAIPYLGVGLALSPDQVALTRPVYAWPQLAHYGGRGDPNELGNWSPQPP
jgi:Tannase and feruloyl esterase